MGIIFSANERESTQIVGSPSSTVLDLFMFICGRLRLFADKFSVGILPAQGYR